MHPYICMGFSVEACDTFYLDYRPSKVSQTSHKFSPDLLYRKPLYIIYNYMSAIPKFKVTKEGYSSDLVGHIIIIGSFGRVPTFLYPIPNSTRRS
jgi:hypothetical protein